MNRKEQEVRKTKIMLEMDSKSENESFARMVAAAFTTRLNPTIEEIADVKMAVSEAVTNAIIHGYGEESDKKIRMICEMEGKSVRFEISDEGCGIADIKKAMEPLYTTRPDLERSGMGFAFMEAFMDELLVESIPGSGTKVIMKKVFGTPKELQNGE